MKLNGSMEITSEKLREIIQKHIDENNVTLGQSPKITLLTPVTEVEEAAFDHGHFSNVEVFKGIKVLFEVESDIVEC